MYLSIAMVHIAKGADLELLFSLLSVCFRLYCFIIQDVNLNSHVHVCINFFNCLSVLRGWDWYQF